MDLWKKKRRSFTVWLEGNSDAMQHMTKGIYGMMIDNVKNIIIWGNSEEDTICGETGGHKQQSYPLQIGYTANEVHGISVSDPAVPAGSLL